MKKEILIKFLNNNCTEAELHEVLLWANTEALTEEGMKLALDDWNNYHEEEIFAGNEKFTALFERIHEEIDKSEPANRQPKILTLTVFTKWLTRAAAILLIPVLGFLFFILSEKKSIDTQHASIVVDSLEIIAPIGSRTVVQLSDGSKVHLNYGSRIKYPHSFSGNTREIILEGEGFFEVTHNPEKPFIVKTEKMNIRVLGTTFNVLAYPDADVIKTTLVDGKVVLEQERTDGGVQNIGSLEPGQHVAYNIQTGSIYSTKGNIEKYIAWKDGKIVFEDTSIGEVAEKLNHMFNVDIRISKEIEDNIYTGTFIDEPLFQILDLMCIATPVNYKMFPREKLPNGTYAKQKIIIEKKE